MTATITLNSPFDMTEINTNAIFTGTATKETATEVDITATGGHHYVFTGTGFAEFTNGVPFQGAMTGFTLDDTVTATGFDLNVGSFGEADWNLPVITIDGSSGNDTILVYIASTGFGNGGDDVLTATGHSATLLGGAGNDTFNGYVAAGDTVVSYADATAGVKVYLSLAGAHNVGGGQGNDTFNNILDLTGSSFNDHLIGNSGPNILDGGGGIDTLGGSAGDDTLIAYDTSDTLNGGKGFDTVQFNLTAGMNYDASALISVEHLIGTPFDDTIQGANIAMTIDGGAGDDILTGGTHNDILIGGAGNDLLNGGAGYNDIADYEQSTDRVVVDLNTSGPQTISASQGTDTLVAIEGVTGSRFGDDIIGDAHANHLSGEDGNDVINGHAGNDVIEGGRNPDTLTGGAGADTFVYNDPTDIDSPVISSAGSPDLITDFDASEDRFQMNLSNGHILPGAVNILATGELDSGTNYHQEFDAALQTIGTFQAVLFTPDSGTLAGHHYLVVSLGSHPDNVAYDLVVELGSASNLAGFGAQDFI